MATGTTNTPAGFGPIDLGQITVNGRALEPSYRGSIINGFIQRSMMGVSMVTLQLADPYRELLKSLVKQGAVLSLPSYDSSGKIDTKKTLNFVLVQFMKASDQMQLVFESELVHKLRLKTNNGVKNAKSSVGYNVTPFIQSLVEEVVGPGHFVAADYQKTWPYLTKHKIFKVILARGTTGDPNESSWTCMSRLAASVGWRLWENAGTIYFGPDEFWLGTVSQTGPGPVIPPVNKAMGAYGDNTPVLQEFTAQTQLIDFDWDIGRPYGQANVTCMIDGFNFQIGEIVHLKNMGPADGYWMVAGTQRDLFLPQATLTLQVPMPIDKYVSPTSLPQVGEPLQPLKGSQLL